MDVIELNSDSFAEEVENSKAKVLVDFYATWCEPCKLMSPVIEKIAKENETAKICKIDIEQAEDIAEKYGVMSIPTFIAFNDGKVTAQILGVQDEEEILKLIK